VTWAPDPDGVPRAHWRDGTPAAIPDVFGPGIAEGRLAAELRGVYARHPLPPAGQPGAKEAVIALANKIHRHQEALDRPGGAPADITEAAARELAEETDRQRRLFDYLRYAPLAPGEAPAGPGDFARVLPAWLPATPPYGPCIVRAPGLSESTFWVTKLRRTLPSSRAMVVLPFDPGDRSLAETVRNALTEAGHTQASWRTAERLRSVWAILSPARCAALIAEGADEKAGVPRVPHRGTLPVCLDATVPDGAIVFVGPEALTPALPPPAARLVITHPRVTLDAPWLSRWAHRRGGTLAMVADFPVDTTAQFRAVGSALAGAPAIMEQHGSRLAACHISSARHRILRAERGLPPGLFVPVLTECGGGKEVSVYPDTLVPDDVILFLGPDPRHPFNKAAQEARSKSG
jgi:hypothetical protein